MQHLLHVAAIAALGLAIGCGRVKAPEDGDPSSGAGASGDGVTGPVRHPGPCAATETGESWGTAECVATYDADARLTDVTCSGPSGYTAHKTLTYDNGELATVSFEDGDSGGSADTRFTFGPTTVEEVAGSVFYDSLSFYDTTASYEREGFVFWGHPSDLLRWPGASDALLHEHDVHENGDADPSIITESDVTYTYDGQPHQGTRTRSGSDGSTATFAYDDQGRLLEHTTDTPFPDTVTFTYEGDLLVSAGNTSFEHDEAGNLVRKTTSWSVTDYTYDCWE